MRILVTGGAGFIGSNTVVELLKEKHDVIIVDDLSNAHEDVIDKIEHIVGIRPLFYKVDLCDIENLEGVFRTHKIDAVIHFAGKKAVGESVAKPLLYYRKNIDGTLALLELMEKYKVNKFIFSSSATVYGNVKKNPITERFPVTIATSPYGSTKIYNEKILGDFAVAHPDFKVVILRYFNQIGSDETHVLGEKPVGIPNNLMPYISQVAAGILTEIKVYGNDYPTVDGTGVRDYIHVIDLAKGHLAALKAFRRKQQVYYYNLGTGKGTSVLELIKAFEDANGLHIPYRIVARRAGDIPTSFTDTRKAERELGFKATKTIIEACRDSYLFQLNLKK
jgi:UDP-glucose 4-epimerase